MIKNAQICLRLTKNQKDTILKKAKLANMNITDYMINAGIKRKINVTNIPDLHDVKLELKRIGTNINQLTKLANERIINTVNFDEFKSEVAKVWQLLNLLIQNQH